MLTKWEQVQMEMENLKDEIERLNRRLDLFEDLYTDVINVLEDNYDGESEFQRGYIAALKQSKISFIKLFEREVETND